MWNQSSGASIGALLQNLAQNNPQVFQAIMQMVSAQRQQGVGGIGSLPPAQGGPMPMGGNLAMQVPPGGMPRTNGPPAYSGQPPQGGMWGMGGQRPNPGGGAPTPYPRNLLPGMGGLGMGFGGQGGTYGESGTPFGWEGELAPARLTPEQLPGFIRAMGGWPTPGQGGAATGIGGGGSGSVRSDQGRPAAPYRAPAYNPQPTGPKYMPQQPYAQPTGPKYMPPTGPKTYGQTMPAEAPPSFAQPKPFPQPAAQPSLAGNGTSGLDWYAMQAGN